MAAAAILVFYIEILTVCPPYRANLRQHAKFRPKSVKRLQRYGDLTVFFKMAAVRHLGFWKFKFSNGLGG